MLTQKFHASLCKGLPRHQKGQTAPRLPVLIASLHREMFTKFKIKRLKDGGFNGIIVQLKLYFYVKIIIRQQNGYERKR